MNWNEIGYRGNVRLRRLFLIAMLERRPEFIRSGEYKLLPTAREMATPDLGPRRLQQIVDSLPSLFSVPTFFGAITMRSLRIHDFDYCISCYVDFLAQKDPEWAEIRRSTDHANRPHRFVRLREDTLRSLDVQLLIDCILPDPQHIPVLSLANSPAHLKGLAESAYLLDGDPTTTAVLADALDDLGQTTQARHLRQPHRHRQGCWVVEQILRST